LNSVFLCREVIFVSYCSTWLIEEMSEQSLDTRVESVLGETVLDSSSEGFFLLHFQICLICVQHNLFFYSGTLSEQMGNIQDSGVCQP